MTQDIPKLTITELLGQEQYIIPLYQRNYSWRRKDIFQLLQDIVDNTGENPYYLGTLVVSEKGGKFHIIDGQQRYTTLLLIQTVLQRKNVSRVNIKSNLTFEARDESSILLETLLANKHFNNSDVAQQYPGEEQTAMLQAVQDVEDFWHDHLQESDQQNAFLQKFYNSVYLFRATLPEKTDVNHYFEIMNNRGEQLEAHELLKSKLMSKLTTQREREQFAAIWDACSQMDSHIQANFDSTQRIILFDEDSNLKNEQSLYSVFFSAKEEVSPGFEDNSMASILSSFTLEEDFKQGEKQLLKDDFRSVLNFPQLLLVCHKLTNPDATLDDSRLLTAFKYPKVEANPIEFVYRLLRCRVLFDRYVVKQSMDNSDWSWGIKKYADKNNDLVNTFKNEDNNAKLKMVQSMLHACFPLNKNWLFETMKFLFDKQAIEITEATLIRFLEKFTADYLKTQLENSNVLYSGINTPHGIFYVLDYRLWCFYYKNIRGTKDLPEGLDAFWKGISREKFDNFKFVQRSSIEHLMPRSRQNELELTQCDSLNSVNVSTNKVIDCFGNLCLISSSANSRYSSDLPSQKKHDSKKINESLKQQVMFASFDIQTGNSWNTCEILQHHQQMDAMLQEFIKDQVNCNHAQSN